VKECPDPEMFDRLIRKQVEDEERSALLAHLRQGCMACADQAWPAAILVEELGFLPPKPPADAVTGEAVDTAAYAVAVDGAWRTATAELSRFQGERKGAALIARSLLQDYQSFDAIPPEQRPGFGTWAICEALLAESAALRHEDAIGALHAAQLAAGAADHLDQVRYRQELRADLQAQAWAELGNAQRVADQHRLADLSFLKAVSRREAGTGAPRLEARIAELVASLRCAQRDFGEAFRELNRAESIYRRMKDEHNIGRILIQKGVYSGYDSDPEGALQLLEAGIAKLDRSREPRLLLQAVHNCVHLYMELGNLQEARQILLVIRPLFQIHGGRLDEIKLRWLEARLALMSGHHERAETMFREVRDEFAQRGLQYRASIAGLELAAVWMMQGGKDAQVINLVQNLIHRFRDLGVERETLAALLILRDQLRQGYATAEALLLTAKGMEKLTQTRRPEGEERRG